MMVASRRDWRNGRQADYHLSYYTRGFENGSIGFSLRWQAIMALAKVAA